MQSLGKKLTEILYKMVVYNVKLQLEKEIESNQRLTGPIIKLLGQSIIVINVQLNCVQESRDDVPPEAKIFCINPVL